MTQSAPLPAPAPTPPNPYRALLRGAAVALSICLPLVVVCYFYVDRPVAFYVARHHLAKTPRLELLTEPPPLVQGWSPLVAGILVAAWAWITPRRWQRTLMVACLTLIIADQFRQSLGDVCGRYWPETWHDNNPSLIDTGAYGFHPFEFGDDVGSFPSGHTTRIAAFLGVFWIAFPHSSVRALCLLVGVPLALSLIAMNYHFVSDVITGAFLGGIIAAYAANLAGLSLRTTA
jgi:membrane-associated phospholipid phosphatase